MAKANKESVHLVSTAGTNFFYTLRRKKGKAKKLNLRKYDPISRQHVEFQEKKLSRLKKKYVGQTTED